jgi:hypothetical protein
MHHVTLGHDSPDGMPLSGSTTVVVHRMGGVVTVAMSGKEKLGTTSWVATAYV